MAVFCRIAPLGLALLLMGSGCRQSSDETPDPASQESAALDLNDEPAIQNATPEVLLDQAMAAIDQKDFDRSLTLVDAALAKDSTNRQGLFLKGATLLVQASELAATDRAASMRQYRKAADAMRTLRAEHPELRPQERGFLLQALYNEARALAHGNEPDAAMAALRATVANGLDSPEALENDEFLDTLADRDDFQSLKRELAAIQQETASVRAEALLAANQPFPFGFTLPDLDGENVALADLKGKALTIVDVWGTWCPPCRMEIPHFVELYDQYKDDGLEIIGVNYEQVDDVASARSMIKAFLDEYRVTYPCVIGEPELLETIPGFSGFPTTLFLDADGKVRLMLVGYNPKPVLEAIVTTLLAEANAQPDDAGAVSEFERVEPAE